MKRWLLILSGIAMIAGGFGYVYAAKEARNLHTVVISDSGIEPKVIAVKEYEVMKIVVTNKGKKKHNFTIPDFSIYTHNLQSGESTDIEFTVNKKGKFPYFSDIPGKPGVPEPGLTGELQVR
jgi:uncharacterized cupredoxin-like copper-binding protein